MTEDLYRFNDIVKSASHASALVLGGGFIKHMAL
jgi:deoxyhypusine synthase